MRKVIYLQVQVETLIGTLGDFPISGAGEGHFPMISLCVVRTDVIVMAHFTQYIRLSAQNSSFYGMGCLETS